MHHSTWIQYNIFCHFLLNIELKMLDKSWFSPQKLKLKFQAAKIKYLTLDTGQIELEIFDLAKQSKTFVLSLFCRRKIGLKNCTCFNIKWKSESFMLIEYNSIHIFLILVKLCNYINISRGKYSKLIVTFRNGTVGILVCLCIFDFINLYCISSFEIF